MAWANFFIQVFPLTFIAGLGAAFGLGFVAERLPETLHLPIAIFGLVVFIGMVTFRGTGGWNIALLIGFAVIAGAFLGSIFTSESELSWGMALLAALGIMFLSAGVGNWLGIRLRGLGVTLWIGSWGYLLGWILLAMLDSSTMLQTIWAFAGLIIFGGLAATWFANLMTSEEHQNNVSLAIDLFILGLNLFVAGRVLISVVQ